MQNKTITLALDDTAILKMVEFYNDYLVDNTNEYVYKQFKCEKVTITVYTSKKVVFQGENATYEASIWDNSLLSELNFDEEEKEVKKEKKEKKKVEKEPKVWEYIKDHIGSDEVGTGDYFGPMCVCAAYVKESDLPFLNKLGIDDSKKLNDDTIKKIAPYLLKQIPYSQMSVDPKKYNALTKQGYNQAKIKAMLHNQVIHNLRDKVNKRAALTVIDQFISKERYYEYVKFSPYIEGQIKFETKAESKYPAVAVASIIARYSFLTKMKSLSESIGKEIPKGAGKEVDEFGKELVKDKGEEILNEYAKIHFANTKKILENI
jgi:ribonuclease HIII